MAVKGRLENGFFVPRLERLTQMDGMVFFFSYARMDADRRSGNALEKFYLDLDSRIGERLAKHLPCSFKDTDMDTGIDWPEAQKEALLKCPLIVFFLSPYYQYSEFCGKELAVYLMRRELMKKAFPQLPNLIFPVRWIPLDNSGLKVPDSIKHLNSSNYGMTGDIMKVGLKKLLEEDPRNYNRFMNGLVDAMLEAIRKLDNHFPNYHSLVPPIPEFMAIPSVFTEKVSPGQTKEHTAPDLIRDESEPGKSGQSNANTKNKGWNPFLRRLKSLVLNRKPVIAGIGLAGLAMLFFFFKEGNHFQRANNSVDTVRYIKEFHWPKNDGQTFDSALSHENPVAFNKAPNHIRERKSNESRQGNFITTVFAPVTEYVFDQPITIASGAPKKSFSKIFANIQAVCGESVPLKEVITTGGLDNLGELASKGAHLGLVGVDVYLAMKETDDAIGRLQAVMSLNTELLHILVLKAGYRRETDKVCTGKIVSEKCEEGKWIPTYKTKIIEKDSDLKGLTVAAVGSAQVIARRYLNSILDLALTIVDVDTDAKAQADLKAGRVQAVLTLAAFPSGPIGNLNQADGFALANWESNVSGVYKTTKKNYANIGSFGITFLSSQNLLMARPVDPNGKIGLKITKLKECIIENLESLKEGEEFEPSWYDIVGVTVPENIPGWPGAANSR